MKDLIIIAGAPGSGKSTVGELLREHKGFPLIEFGWLRQGHLNNNWSNATSQEEQMALENLTFIIKNYWKNGYKNVVVTDLQDIRVREIPKLFSEKDFIIFTLILESEDELKKRVSRRTSGFINTKEALGWNRELIMRPAVKNEFKIDNSGNDSNIVVKKILSTL